MFTSPANMQSMEKLLAEIGKRQSFLITSHARPDGDAIGSSLALMHLLDGMGKDVAVCFADPVPDIYAAIPGVERIRHDLPAENVECAILMECDCIARSGYTALPADCTINIDHHLSGREYATYNWIDSEAPAVGAMVFDMAQVSGQPITPAMATCVYTALVTDTGSFLYSTTTADTFAIAAKLLYAGADSYAVTQAVFFSTPRSKMRLLARALTRMEIRGEVAWSWVTEQDLVELEATVEDCEGIVNYLIGMAGICAAAFLREQPGGQEFRISLRSRRAVDVSRVAQEFAGGGHRNASGGSIDGPLDVAIERLTTRLQRACDDALRPTA
ncbi:bifunctional oligoribonuclease/PAP phosphatase NrnA [Granulicella cerasi]|uniref:Bifunctional oligoribonuclease/PAP phosphatase NrnA n=1 Tax=Granulicella cerasi TaxID=741063 RepID=A0ABW1ZCZ4_9BACT|nr:bifunctional oligoribonuclease/PAP phosphatase NrnA [Granulicella cerasi]